MAAAGHTQQALGPSSPPTATFESIQARTASLRRARARPPDIVVGDADRAPLRQGSRTERVSKRESRVGLRSILGLPKTGRDQDERDQVGRCATMRETPHARVRASLSDTHWLHHSPSRSELSINNLSPPPTSSSTFSGVRKSPSMSRFRHLNSSTGRLLPEAMGSAPDLWAPSPLFQAYPQAIKQATLPACTERSDTLLRRNGARSSVLVGGARAPDEDANKPKKLHQKHTATRHSLDWTTKTYILVTSGYLLQYSSNGSFNRLPERILRLTKDSAAFASDLIPGRHWVIQVVSCMGADAAPASDARSILSKLTHWGSDKKSAPNFLMVLESAEEMEEWLTVLRQEIEKLGGKRQLSETGEPKPDSTPNELGHSQRTMVLRDPERFSTLITEDFAWSNEHALREPARPLSVTASAQDVTSDDVSTAESRDSSDGQQLDSLRGSGSNRLSYMSSGQRTVVTSADSTPECSPTRQSFSSNPDEAKAQSPVQDTSAGVRLRPNAQDIVYRRQSMQVGIPKYEAQIDHTTRPHSSASTYADSSASNPDVPNFSKRLPDARFSPSSLLDQAPIPEIEVALKSSRKPPPTALAKARPLSTVLDLPSPHSLMPPLEPIPSLGTAPANPRLIRRSLYDEKSDAAPVHQDEATAATQQEPLRSSQSPLRVHRVAPRQSISLANLRPRKDSLSGQPQFVLSSGTAASRRAQFDSLSDGCTKPEQENMAPFSAPSKQAACKRTSCTPHDLPRSYLLQSYAPSIETSPNSNPNHPPSQNASVRRQFLTPLLPTKAYLEGHAAGRPLTIQRSMPHLLDGPPLAPPPTRALPPIPKKH